MVNWAIHYWLIELCAKLKKEEQSSARRLSLLTPQKGIWVWYVADSLFIVQLVFFSSVVIIEQISRWIWRLTQYCYEARQNFEQVI